MSTPPSTGRARNGRGAGAPERTRWLLESRILPAIGRLTAPGLVLSVFQTAVSITDTWFVGRLGTDALAGLALVFPLAMMLHMISAGAMGGGVSSAVARALGGGDPAAARRVVAHALAIAIVAGLAFTLAMLTLGRPIYRLLGGREAALASALAYSDVLFAAAVLVWLANTLASALRGSGNTLVPALAMSGSAILHIALSAGLTLGLGPFPRMGIAGAATASAIAFGLSTLTMGAALWRGPLRPGGQDWRFEYATIREILRVGAFSTLASAQTVLASVALTGFVGGYGAAALAGYGVGLRLELLQMPIVFSIGQAVIALVGANIGAGDPLRAKRIAWTGASLSMAVSLAVTLFAWFFPAAWVGLFSSDPAVLDAGRLYLLVVSPLYPLFGASMTLYFASQGAGHVVLPMLAGTARLATVLIGGALVVSMAAPLGALFAVIACGITVLATLMALAVHRSRWGLPARAR